MQFYHGTRNKDLKELNLDHYSGKIYITDDHSLAFMYASSPLRFWNYDKKQNKVIFREIGKNHFKILYQGKKCYIFTCNVDEFTKDNGRSGHTFTTNKPVQLDQPPEEIHDAYSKLMEMAEKGEVLLERWEDMSPEIQEERRKKLFNVYTPARMKEEKEKFPEAYEFLIKLFPELKI